MPERQMPSQAWRSVPWNRNHSLHSARSGSTPMLCPSTSNGGLLLATTCWLHARLADQSPMMTVLAWEYSLQRWVLWFLSTAVTQYPSGTAAGLLIMHVSLQLFRPCLRQPLSRVQLLLALCVATRSACTSLRKFWSSISSKKCTSSGNAWLRAPPFLQVRLQNSPGWPFQVGWPQPARAHKAATDPPLLQVLLQNSLDWPFHVGLPQPGLKQRGPSSDALHVVLQNSPSSGRFHVGLPQPGRTKIGDPSPTQPKSWSSTCCSLLAATCEARMLFSGTTSSAAEAEKDLSNRGFVELQEAPMLPPGDVTTLAVPGIWLPDDAAPQPQPILMRSCHYLCKALLSNVCTISTADKAAVSPPLANLAQVT